MPGLRTGRADLAASAPRKSINVAQIFPKAVVRRMDADSMTRKDAYRETLRNFRTGKIDILVGTQMIAKGLHFPNVTLVGIINADLALHLPDFRAGERTFQLLTQVAGRAGRGETAGEVFVQTYTPFSPSIQFARHHDFAGYFQQELEFRERCDFPPFKHAILITVRSAHEGRAKLSAETLKRRLKEALPEEFILGDATPAPLEKLQGQFRFHILIRGKHYAPQSPIRETPDKRPLRRHRHGRRRSLPVAPERALAKIVSNARPLTLPAAVKHNA
jgi:primosomal protein N' (replication factor Y)